MPELPEVQTLVDDLKESNLCGCTIKHAIVNWQKIIARPSLIDFSQQIRNTTITNIRRRGKYIIFELSDNLFLIVHLRMTGKLYLTQSETPHQKHEHVILYLNSGHQLIYHDSRKFGRFFLVDDLDQVLSKLGPEPLSDQFTPAVLSRIIKNHKRMIKPLLLDQSMIAGLGNIYADEALWDAGIHPETNTASLEKKQINRLHYSIQKVLKKGIKNLGTTLGSGITNFYSISGRKGNNKEDLKVFRRTGLPCPRCKSSIDRIIVAQRSSHVCLNCQKF